jgi:hypothetical protein
MPSPEEESTRKIAFLWLIFGKIIIVKDSVVWSGFSVWVAGLIRLFKCTNGGRKENLPASPYQTGHTNTSGLESSS